MKHLAFTMICAVAANLSAQVKIDQSENEEWYSGEVHRTNGDVLTGMVNYNFFNDILRVKDGNGKEKVVMALHVARFSVYKDDQEISFITLPFDRLSNGRKIATIFRVVHQGAKYSILSKHVLQVSASTQLAYKNHEVVVSDKSFVMLEQVYETIYLADNMGKIVACLHRKMTKDDIDMDFDLYSEVQGSDVPGRTVLKDYQLVDKKSFENFFGRRYKEFERYAKENDLDFQTIRGLKLSLVFE